MTTDPTPTDPTPTDPTPTGTLTIRTDDPTRSPVRELLSEHLANMHAVTPLASVHALGPEALAAPDITFWSVWDGDALAGCGALRELDAGHGEVKSMRTPEGARRRGAGRAVLAHIVAEAQARGYRRLSLETGASEAFEPARRLYASAGFAYVGPFGDYRDDPNSVFMTREL